LIFRQHADALQSVFEAGHTCTVVLHVTNASRRALPRLRIRLRRHVALIVKGHIETVTHDVAIADLNAAVPPREHRTLSVDLKVPDDIEPTCSGRTITCRYSILVQLMAPGFSAQRWELVLPVMLVCCVCQSALTLCSVVAATPRQGTWYTALPVGFVPVEHELREVHVTAP
jgi:DNA-binding FrmR family transcriptional regulator